MSARPLGGRDVAIAGLLLALVTGFLAATNPLLALAAFFAIVFVTWIVNRPDLVLMVMVAALPWEAMLHYPSATLSAVKLLGMALVGAYLLRAVRRDEQIRTSPIIGIALFFVIVVFLSMVASPELSVGTTKAFRYGFYVVFLFLVSQLVSDLATGRRLLQVYCASAAVAGLIGLASFLSLGSTRAAGPIEDPNDFGYLMATVVPLAVYLYIESRRLRPFWGVTLALLLGATAATYSRGALVGLGALLLWAFATGRVRARTVMLALAAGLVVAVSALTLWAPVINERLEEKERIANQNVESREAYWSAAARMAMDRPLLGVGPARFGVEAPEYVRNNPISQQDPVVHNAYLEILAEDGPFALLFFVAMLVVAWGGLTRSERAARKRGSPEELNFAAAVKGSLIVAAVSTIFLSEQVTSPIWLACGLAASGAVLSLRRERSAPELSRATPPVPA